MHDGILGQRRFLLVSSSCTEIAGRAGRILPSLCCPSFHGEKDNDITDEG
jgi:hypothetical protein